MQIRALLLTLLIASMAVPLGLAQNSPGPCSIELREDGPKVPKGECRYTGEELQVSWKEIDAGEELLFCQSPGKEDPGQRPLGDWCKGRQGGHLGNKTAKSNGTIALKFPPFLETPQSHMSGNDSACTDDRCNMTITLQEASGRTSYRITGTVAVVGLADGGIVERAQDFILSWWGLATVGGVSLVVLFLVLYTRHMRRKSKVADRRKAQGGGPAPTGPPPEPKSSTFSSRANPVLIRVYDAERGTPIQEDVSIQAQGERQPKKKGAGRWELPKADPKGYPIKVDAPNYEPKRVKITDQYGPARDARVSLSPKTGTVIVDVKNADGGGQIGGIPFDLRSGGESRSRGSTNWDRPVRVPDIPFGSYQVILDVPSLFRLTDDAAEKGSGSDRVGRRLQVQPDTSVSATFELEPAIPSLSLPEQQRDRLAQAMDNVRSYDDFIPHFLEQIVKDYGNHVDQSIRQDPRPILDQGIDEAALVTGVRAVQEQLTEGVLDSITSRSNLSLFASTQEGRPPPDPEPLRIATAGVLVDEERRSAAAEELKGRLGPLDERLTKLSRELTIRPLADLLALGRSLIDDGASNPETTHGGARLLAADLCLGALNQAMRDEAFHPHLEGGGL